jgi:prepilin-type N-terminal cleavage/methylation domain-containing protein
MSSLKLQKAFTLIELMVVVAIIAILTAIVIANLTQAKAKSRDAKRISDLNQIQLALELFFDRCNQYPASSGNLPNIDAGKGGGNGCPTGITLGTFISKIPTPPNPGESYYYAVDSTNSDYLLKAVLEGDNSALTDSYHGPELYSISGTVACSPSTSLAYCVQPR